MDPEEMFNQAAEVLMTHDGIVRTKMFGSPGLKVNGRFFASLVRGRLVVKLPQGRVRDIVTAGEGEHFDSGMGRVMKEWVAVQPEARVEWVTLMQEAKDFVAQVAAGEA